MDYPYKNKNIERIEIKSVSPQGTEQKIEDIATTIKNEGNGSIQSDVIGSYTGLTNDGETPVQDSDDL